MLEKDSYGETHRRFLKNLMTSHIVPQAKAVELYCSCRDIEKSAGQGKLCLIFWFKIIISFSLLASQELGKEPEKAIANFIQQINAKIEPLNLSIKLITCEATIKRYYVLYTMNENEVTK